MINLPSKIKLLSGIVHDVTFSLWIFPVYSQLIHFPLVLELPQWKFSRLSTMSSRKSSFYGEFMKPLFSLIYKIPFTAAPPVAERFCAQSWQTECGRFNPRSCLSTYPFGVFGGFLRNSHKYGLGSLRKTPMAGTLPTGPGLTSGQLALTLQPTNQPFYSM